MKLQKRSRYCATIIAVGCAFITSGLAAINSAHAQTTTAIATPAASSDPTPEAWRQFRIIEKAEYFALGGVGIAGTPAPGKTALDALLKEKGGPTLLRGLLKTATPAGKLYALMGLRQTGTPREVTEVADSLRKRTEPVLTFHGCIGGRQTIGALVTEIEKGGYPMQKMTVRHSTSPKANAPK